jgi:hypothetical protein
MIRGRSEEITVTVQALLCSSLSIPIEPASGRSFLRRLLDAIMEGRQRKASLEITKYLARHPEYRNLR